MTRFWRGTWLVAVLSTGLGGLYACSGDDTSPASSSGGTNKDAGGGSDTSTATDTGGGGNDTGTGTDTGTQARHATVTIAPYGDAGTTKGNGTFAESNGSITLTLDVTNAVPGARGVHVHLGTSCAVGGPGGHFNPNPATLNGMFDNIAVDDGGVGHLSSTRAGITLDPWSDGGAGIVGRVLAVHAAPLPVADAGPDADAGPAPPPPISGCGVITAQ